MFCSEGLFSASSVKWRSRDSHPAKPLMFKGCLESCLPYFVLRSIKWQIASRRGVATKPRRRCFFPRPITIEFRIHCRLALAQREMERHFFANRWARARRFCARRSPFRTRLAMNTKFAGWKIETSSAYGAVGRRVFVVSVSRFIRASLIAAFRTSQKVVLICVIESGDTFLPAPPINNTRESTHDAFMNKSSPRTFVTAALKGVCLKIETHQSLGLFASWARVSLRARLAVFQRAPFIVGYSARTPV